MAVAQCKKHGEVMSSLLSPVVAKAFNEDKKNLDLVRVNESIDGSTDWGQSFQVSKSEIGEKFPILKVDESNESLYENFVASLEPYCSVCFRDWVEKRSIFQEEIEIDID